ncbi:MAG: ABC transporter permease [Parafilimonas sp.]|nr:ABC transporter permease [Parafilimonas sp.]
MSKISLIIQREYLSRVRSRSFILTTFLTPLLFVCLIFGAAYLSYKGKEQLKVAVVDDNGFFKDRLKGDDDVQFYFPADVDTLNYLSKGYSALLTITKIDTAKKQTFYVRSQKAIGIGASGNIENKIDAVVEDNMLQQSGIMRSKLDSIHESSHIANVVSLEESEGKAKESNQTLASVVGYVCGTLIYIVLLIYGMMVLRGVMEEKTNRIAEVVVSSVKPFELMMGKIVGIGAVGLTQFIMWIVLIIALSTGAQAFIPHDTMQQVQALQQSGGIMQGNTQQISANAQFIFNTQHTLSTANWPLIIGCFIFYFLGGYLFYASLFAAVGCVTEDVQSSQSLTLPITMPVIFSFIIGTNAVQVPDSQLAIWASIIPFSSPIVMMCRIAYGVPGTVPYWQLISSVLALIAGFLFTTWLAGKIYRTGILMYGKKTSWKEMWKWAFRKS